MQQDRKLYNVHIRAIKPLPTPLQLIRAVPVSERARASVLEGRAAIEDILDGRDPRLMVIVGPCSIHDRAAALEYAKRLAALAEQVSDRILIVMRVYFDKPRTTVGWKGLINDPHLNDTFNMPTGLKTAREILLEVAELGLPAAIEFVNPIVPQYLADLVSWNAIGARTTESQTHREVASGLSMPVGCKNGTGGNTYSIRIAVEAVKTIASPHTFPSVTEEGISAEVDTEGNPYGHLVLRGGEAGPNYREEWIASAVTMLQDAGVRTQLVVDCSHGNSRKNHENQPGIFQDLVGQRVAGNTNIVGIMVESNLFPGAQKLSGDPSQLKYGVSITDACIGWDETEALLRWAHQQLGVVPSSSAVPAD